MFLAHPFVFLACGAVLLLGIQRRLDVEQAAGSARAAFWGAARMCLLLAMVGFFAWTRVVAAAAERRRLAEAEAVAALRHARASIPSFISTVPVVTPAERRQLLNERYRDFQASHTATSVQTAPDPR